MEFALVHPTLVTTVTGTLDQSGSVARYKGIKYAAVQQRWTRSTIIASYPDAVDARRFGPHCPQPEEPNSTGDFGPFIPFEHDGSDDKECLNLNVTMPVKLDKPVPVFVWIHGGSLRFGAGSDPIWDPTVLVRESAELGRPIVVVTINYRLGPFGFLTPPCLDKDAAKGNFGFHDQVVALEWVQRHIRGFGGDPTMVTIGGESAGGCSVHALINYQEKLGMRKYFRRAVMQSGNIAVMGYWGERKMESLWKNALQEMGIADDEHALHHMQEASWERIAKLRALNVSGYGVFRDDLFLSPPSFSSTGDLLPSELLTVDAVMHGDNADEGNVFRFPAQEPNVLNDLDLVATEVLGQQGKDELFSIYGLDDEMDEKELFRRLHRFPEDARFYLPSDKVVEVWPKAAFYHLTATCPFASSPWKGESFHTFDLLYLFGSFEQFLENEGHEEHMVLGRKIRSTWVDFFHGADPWKGAFGGVAATFTVEGMKTGEVTSARGWDNERKTRIGRLQKLGFVKIVEIATRTFP